MSGLADIVLDYLCTLMFYSEGNIDAEFASRELELLPELFRDLSPEERGALSQAAQRALDKHRQPPDEYGYKPQISDHETDFLEALARGDLYAEWCK